MLLATTPNKTECKQPHAPLSTNTTTLHTKHIHAVTNAIVQYMSAHTCVQCIYMHGTEYTMYSTGQCHELA